MTEKNGHEQNTKNHGANSHLHGLGPIVMSFAFFSYSFWVLVLFPVGRSISSHHNMNFNVNLVKKTLLLK